MNKALAFTLTLSLAACATRAPTDYELDRRAGLMPAIEVQKAKAGAEEMRRIPGGNKPAAKPVRASPWFEKVWVYDHEIEGGYWLQGTYLFLEVEPGRWVRPGEETP